jgi:hypothetical protein
MAEMHAPLDAAEILEVKFMALEVTLLRKLIAKEVTLLRKLMASAVIQSKSVLLVNCLSLAFAQPNSVACIYPGFVL